jgi:hypothetical protein
METARTVDDRGKLTNEGLGALHRRFDEIKRRINDGALDCKAVLDVFQRIVNASESSNKYIRPRLLQENIIKIDRSQIFNPTTFIRPGWTIAEQDERSLALTQVDLSLVSLKSTLMPDERFVIKGEERLRRVKAMKCIRLDAMAAQVIYENQSRIPEEWKGFMISFDGTILCDSDGIRRTLCLYWYHSEWKWVCEDLTNTLSTVYTAVLDAA